MTTQPDNIKHTIDAISLVTVVGTFMNLLPSIAALFTIIWTGIRIYETDTVQQLLGRKKVNTDAEQD